MLILAYPFLYFASGAHVFNFFELFNGDAEFLRSELHIASGLVKSNERLKRLGWRLQ